MFKEPHCQLDHFPTWEYPEYYRCPECRAVTRAELERGLAKWKAKPDDEKTKGEDELAV
jgi:hypothetical protein